MAWKAPRLQLIHYLSPANDVPATYQHANGARRIVAIWTVVGHRTDPIVEALGAKQADTRPIAFETRETAAAALADGTCLMLSARAAKDPVKSAALAVLIEVDSLTRVSLPVGQPLTRSGPAVWLTAAQMHGVWLGFIERSAWAGLRCAA